MTLVLLVLAHLLVAALWLALSVRLQYQLKRATAGDAGAVSDGSGTVRTMTIAAIVFYVLAVGAFFSGGGFDTYGPYPAFHAAFALGLVLVLVQVLLIQTAWGRVAAGDSASGKRVTMGLGVAHLTWVVLVVLMFFGRNWIGYWG